VHFEKLHFFERFVVEREAIRLKREAGEPAPWTDDPVLSTWRFVNVRRIDDRVSRALLAEWYPQFSGRALWPAAMVARFVNFPPTLRLPEVRASIGASIDEFDPVRFAAALNSIDGKVFGGGYIIPGGKAGVDKPTHVGRVIASAAAVARDVEAGIDALSIEQTVRALAQVKGVGEFMAGQAACDLSYLPGQLFDATDKYSYAPPGPGSSKGWNILLDRPDCTPIVEAEWREGLPQLVEIGQQYVPDLDANSAQSCLCEIEKIVNFVRGKKRPKAKYTPHTY
jgi:hypothetical protein